MKKSKKRDKTAQEIIDESGKRKKMPSQLELLRRIKKRDNELKQYQKELKQFKKPYYKKSFERIGSRVNKNIKLYIKKDAKKLTRAGSRLTQSFLTAGRPSGRYKKGLPAVLLRKQEMERQRVLNEINAKRLLMRQQKGYSLEDKPLRERDFVNNLPISSGTLEILDKIKQIQNKGKIDNLEMQRRIKERRIVGNQMNLLKTPTLFGPESNTFDLFDETGNPLKAPNMFKENPNNVRILNTRRLNLLQTREAGNDLRF